MVQVTWHKHKGIVKQFRYSLGCPHLNMTKVEKDRVIQANVINLENKLVWINLRSLGKKMATINISFIVFLATITLHQILSNSSSSIIKRVCHDCLHYKVGATSRESPICCRFEMIKHSTPTLCIGF